MATHVSDTGSKGRSRGSASDELAMIAQRAQAFTNASGTAIALSEGNLDEIVCRARSGSNAPDVGTAMRVEGSFTGLCIQSGKELRCDDAETDTRVDTTALRALGIRSMVVTPIKEENRVVGVLAVFAPTAHAFTITHVAVLKTMADQISALLQKERRAKDDPSASDPALPATPVATPQAIPPAPTLPPLVITPAAPTAAPVAAPAPAPRPAFPVISKKVEPIKTTVVAEDIATPVALPRKEERARTDIRASLTSFDGASEEKKSGVSLILIGAVVVIVIGVASTFAYLKFRKPTATASVVPPHTQEPSSIPNAPPSATVSPAPSAPANNPQPAPPVVSSSAPAARPVPVSSTSETSKKSDKTPVPVRSNEPERTAAEKPTPATVALSTAPSKIATPSGSADSGQSQDPSAPALNLGGGTSGSGALSALTKSASGSKPAMMTQSELEPVQVLKRVAPIYPAIAKQRRLSGTLIVQAMVGKDGKISDLVLVSGPPVFRDAAFEAIRQWTFKPAMLNGQPIDQSTSIRLQFNP